MTRKEQSGDMASGKGRNNETPLNLIDVQPLLERIGARREISLPLPSDVTEPYGIAFTEPPTITGVLENKAGVLLFTYKVEGLLQTACDRCLTDLQIPLRHEGEYVIVTGLQSDGEHEDFWLAENGMLDVAEIAMTDLRLAMPTKTLCREDCKGLCTVCGANRNEVECHCMQAQAEMTV